MPRRRRLSREEIEEQFGTTGGFMIPLRLTKRAGLIWVGLLAVFAVLALVGGLPGGTGSVDLRRVFEPFPATETVGTPAPSGAQAIAEDLQETWRGLFAGAGEKFEPAKIVVYDKSATSDCLEQKATEPPRLFYCHADKRLLVDRRLTNPYAIAHGYAHHVQELLAITDQIARAAEASPSQGDDLWRRHELQADCLAGVWAHRYPKTQGSFGSAPLPTARDHFIETSSWTAPSSEQREKSFRQGSERGDPSVCDTFSAGP